MNHKEEKGLIDFQYADIIQKEGHKALALVAEFNGNERILNLIKKIKHADSKETEYKVEHLFLHDLLHIFKNYVDVMLNINNIPNKSKFILIYFYDLFQGKDLLKKYSLAQINTLIQAPNFENNINVILKTPFFKPNEKLGSEYILPVILKMENHEKNAVLVSIFNRIANVLVKTDDKVSKKEEEFLHEVNLKLNHPKLSLDQASYSEIAQDDTLEKVMAELNELIGLENVKKTVSDVSNFLKVQEKRNSEGLKTSNNSLHAVFMGPPGTGKTTIARLLGRIYKHLGYLKKGHLIETDRAGMVAGYVGQTAIKVDEIIQSAIGGVLFIDEAYALTSKGFNDFGSEAIETLLKRMEDHRKELVVIVAGYPDEMKIFIESNPGLQSRFNRFYNFKSFDANELLQIFNIIAKKGDFLLSEDAEEKLLEIFERVCEKKDISFGNARSARNLFEKITERQANRIVSIEKVSKDILMTITEEDIPPILDTVKEMLHLDSEEINKK